MGVYSGNSELPLSTSATLSCTKTFPRSRQSRMQGGYSDVHTLSRDVTHDMKDTVCMSDCVVTVDGLRTRNV